MLLACDDTGRHGHQHAVVASGERQICSRECLALTRPLWLILHAFRKFHRDLDTPGLAALGDYPLFNCDQRRKLRHEVVLESKLCNLFAQVIAHRAALQATPILGHKHVDFLSCPHAGDDRVALLPRRQVERNLTRISVTGALRSQANHALRRSRIAPRDYDRASAEQIIDALGIDIGHRQRTKIERDIGKQRRAQMLIEAVCCLFCLFVVMFIRNVFHLAPASLGHLVEQKAIDAGADAIGKDARVRMLLDLADNLHVIPDLAIG